MSEDVIKLQNFQQKKLAVAHLATGSKGKVPLSLALKISSQDVLWCLHSPCCAGQFVELFGEKLQRNELILRDDLKLLLHLCQSADDMLVAKDAIYR